MSSMRMKMNDDGLHQLLLEVAATVEAADESFRATHTGLPVDVVVVDAPDALPLEMNEAGLLAYAQAVSAGEPFLFELGG